MGYSITSMVKQRDTSSKIQLGTSPEHHPTEDASVVWDEVTSPYQTIGTIEFPKQNSFSQERRKFWEERMALDLWRCLAAHQPLGSINRLRKVVYGQSAKKRGNLNLSKAELVRSIDEISYAFVRFVVWNCIGLPLSFSHAPLVTMFHPMPSICHFTQHWPLALLLFVSFHDSCGIEYEASCFVTGKGRTIVAYSSQDYLDIYLRFRIHDLISHVSSRSSQWLHWSKSYIFRTGLTTYQTLNLSLMTHKTLSPLPLSTLTTRQWKR